MTNDLTAPPETRGGGLDLADGAPPRTVLHIPHAPVSVTLARKRLREDLMLAGIPETTVDDAEIVLSELLGNAVRHAQAGPSGSVEVRWQVVDDVVEVIVTDGGATTTVAARDADELSPSGRGLHIVAAVARAWGVIDQHVARTVWAALVVPHRGQLQAS